MAKSIRSKRMKSNRALLRKTLMGPIEEQRLKRLSERLNGIGTGEYVEFASEMSVEAPVEPGMNIAEDTPQDNNNNSKPSQQKERSKKKKGDRLGTYIEMI